MTATLHRRHDTRAWGLDADGEHWDKHAACRGEDPELWTHIRSTGTADRPNATERRAIEICGDCPVRAECFNDAAEAPWETTGVIRAGLFWPLRLNPGMTDTRRRVAAARTTPTAAPPPKLAHCRWCGVAISTADRARYLCGDACRKAEHNARRAEQRRRARERTRNQESAHV